MFKSILLPLDGSPFAEHSIPLAASVARRSGATIRLLQIMAPLGDRYFWAPLPGSDIERDLHAEYRKQSLAYLHSVGQKLNGLPYICDVLNEHIDIPEAIATEVAKTGVDLVVMSSHGRGLLKRVWLGSIADQVYRSSAIPVLLAKPQQEKVDWGQTWDVKRVLVALDGTAEAEEILDPVLSIAESFHAELLFVEVILAAPEQADGVNSSANHSSAVDPHAYLEALAERFRVRGIAVKTSLLVSADVSAAILRSGTSADLIAMRTHARGGVPRLFFGSVVDHVVQNSAVPILITRPHPALV